MSLTKGGIELVLLASTAHILRLLFTAPPRGPAADSWNSVTANEIEAFQQLAKERK